MNIENISIEADEDLIFVTVAKYKLFLSYGKIGMDAYLLYSHLMFTARLQGTNSIKANNIYIRQGLKWTKERLNKAKSLLFDLNLAEPLKKRDKSGKITGWYIIVKTKKSPFEIENLPTDPENQTVDNPPRWDSDPKCFNKETNALTKKENSNKEKCSFVTNLREYFTKTNDSYYHDGKQAKSLKYLQKFCAGDEVRAIEFCNKHLKIKNVDKTDYWRNSPHTPANIYCRKDYIAAYELNIFLLSPYSSFFSPYFRHF